MLQISHNFSQLPLIDILKWGYHTENGKVNDSKCSTIHPNPPIYQIQDRLRPRINIKQPQRVSKIFPALLGCYQQFLLDMMRRRWPFGLERQLEMTDDPVDCLLFFDKRDDSHLTTTCGATQGIHRCQKIKRNRFWCPLSYVNRPNGRSFPAGNILDSSACNRWSWSAAGIKHSWLANDSFLPASFANNNPGTRDLSGSVIRRENKASPSNDDCISFFSWL